MKLLTMTAYMLRKVVGLPEPAVKADPMFTREDLDAIMHELMGTWKLPDAEGEALEAGWSDPTSDPLADVVEAKRRMRDEV